MNFGGDDHQLYDMDQPPPQQQHLQGPGPPQGEQMSFGDGFPGPQFPPGSAGPLEQMGGPNQDSMSSKEQALMWQQGHYMGGGGQGGESGFISAATTQPSSQSGHDEEILTGTGDGGMGCYTGPGSMTGSSLYDLDSAHPSGKSTELIFGSDSRARKLK